MYPAPFRSAVAVTPHASADQGLDNGCSAICVQVAGDVAVVMKNGASVTLPLPAGVIEIDVTRIKAIGTTATGFAALWR